MKAGKTMANKKAKTEPIRNPELDRVIQEMKESSPAAKQDELVAALKTAKLLSPCDFDVDIGQQKDGTVRNAHPSQIKFYLLNTNDGKTLFPVFTDFERSKKVQFGKDIVPKLVVRATKDFDQLLADNQKAAGIVINPGTDNVVIPRNLVGVVAGRLTPPKPVNQANPVPAPFVIHYSEPSVYPTRAVNAVYERCVQEQEISRVWLKQKTAGPASALVFFVEADKTEERILNAVREVAVPLMKDVPVEAVFVNEKLMKDVIKESVPLYDRELEL